jgi:hypothetical protein
MVSALSSGATDGAVSISLGSDFTAAVTTTTAQSPALPTPSRMSCLE